MVNVEVCDQRSFYPRFAMDLKNAKALVLIQSPFVSESRLQKLERSLKACIERNVRVCVFLQQPHDATPQEQAVAKGTEKLLTIGVHVGLRKFIHEKIAIIDEAILWDGSLNILSHTRLPSA
jgi:phosphatidylserine/phosphatidylglycerophosphate/cardiolipin synthase-like enzyme